MSEHTQVASYALGLLDPIEMTNFEIHLADCDECADQLEWLLPVAGQLSEVEPGDLYGVSGPSAFTVSGSPPPQQQSLPGGRNSQAAPPTSPTPFPPSRGAHTGEIPTTANPTRSPWTGEIPVRNPRTGGIPTNPPTGGIPTNPPTGEISGRNPRTGGIPTTGRRASEFPELREPTGEVPISSPPTGENRIVPLVRGGDSRRRQAKLAQEGQTQPPTPLRPQSTPPPAPEYPQRSSENYPPAESYSAGESFPASRDYERSQPRPRRSESGDAFDAPRRSRSLMLATAAAFIGALAGAGAVAAHPWSSGDDGTVAGIAIAPTGNRLEATDGKTGVRADAVLDQKAWGTLVSFAVTDVDGPRKCRLVAVKADGQSEVLSSWTVPSQGYGPDTVPPELTLQASTALKRSEITSLQVQDVRGSSHTTLVTIPT